jgi:hypothetical protein
MSHEMLSILVWCWHDPQTHTTQLHMVHADTAEEVRLKKGSFLLRISRDEGSSVERCLIRHIASGREAYIQSSKKLREFVKDCLLDSDTTASTESDG